MYKITRVVPFKCHYETLQIKVADVVENLQDDEILISINYCEIGYPHDYVKAFLHIGKVI